MIGLDPAGGSHGLDAPEPGPTAGFVAIGGVAGSPPRLPATGVPRHSPCLPEHREFRPAFVVAFRH